MFKKSPKINNCAAKTSALIALLSGAVIIIISNGNIPMPWIAQSVGIILVAYSIYVAVAYLLRTHAFIVTENGERTTHIFKINELKGKREITVCRVRLDEIKFIREVNGQNKKDVERERKSKKRYTYDAQFMPQRRLELDILCDGEQISVLTTYDDELINYLLSLGVTKK